jgi:hypothetical protein
VLALPNEKSRFGCGKRLGVESCWIVASVVL